MARRKKHTKDPLPKLTNPMHLSPEYTETKLEKSGVSDPLVSTIQRGTSEVSQMFDAVNEVREKILQDRTLNGHAKKAEFAKYLDKKGDKIFNKIQRIQKAIDKRTDELDDKITGPISEEAHTQTAQEVRQHVQKLPDKSKRMSFIKRMVDQEDWESCSACLGTKYFLAGLDKDTRDNLMTYYRQKRFSEEQKTIETFQKIQKGLFHRIRIISEFEKSLKTDEVLKSIQGQEARRKAMAD